MRWRCGARDSVPPLRLEVLNYLACTPGARSNMTFAGAWTSREPPSIGGYRPCMCSVW